MSEIIKLSYLCISTSGKEDLDTLRRLAAVGPMQRCVTKILPRGDRGLTVGLRLRSGKVYSTVILNS